MKLVSQSEQCRYKGNYFTLSVSDKQKLLLDNSIEQQNKSKNIPKKVTFLPPQGATKLKDY